MRSCGVVTRFWAGSLHGFQVTLRTSGYSIYIRRLYVGTVSVILSVEVSMIDVRVAELVEISGTL